MTEKNLRNQIIAFLQKNGPALPVQIAKQTGMDTLFAGAFLSELVDSEEVKISNMKVGNSPLYFIPGQENLLERFAGYLEKKEQEACSLLERQKILDDKKQKPAIRVALRSLKDFAVPFRFNNQVFWKYFLTSNEEAGIILQKDAQKTTKKTEEEPAETPKPEKQKQQKPIAQAAQKPIPVLERQARLTEKQEQIPRTRIKKEKQKSEFAENIKSSLAHHKIPVIEEISARKKEYEAIVRINSDLGPIEFFLKAKDKKSISVTDLMDTIREAQNRGMLALFLSPGELNKKSEEYALENSGILKIKRLRH